MNLNKPYLWKYLLGHYVIYCIMINNKLTQVHKLYIKKNTKNKKTIYTKMLQMLSCNVYYLPLSGVYQCNNIIYY